MNDAVLQMRKAVLTTTLEFTENKNQTTTIKPTNQKKPNTTHTKSQTNNNQKQPTKNPRKNPNPNNS